MLLIHLEDAYLQNVPDKTVPILKTEEEAHSMYR